MIRSQITSQITAQIASIISGGATNSIAPFTVDKIVFLGASITDRSVSSESTRSYAESYITSKFGKTVAIVERATAGKQISETAAEIDGIIAEFASEPNTHYAMHALGNDILVGTEFLDLTPSKQEQLIEDLEYIYDAVHAQGRKLIQTSTTFRNYGLATIDNDPAVKVNELNGSYTYIRDWLVPVMQRKAPEYLLNDWTILDLYNVTSRGSLKRAY